MCIRVNAFAVSVRLYMLFTGVRGVTMSIWKLGVDLDNAPYWKVLATYFNMKYFYGNVRVYKTERGWHFETEVPTSVEARLGLCDDEKRLYLSEERMKVTGILDDVLFDSKFDGSWRKRECVDEKSLLADEFWKPVGRVKRYAGRKNKNMQVL